MSYREALPIQDSGVISFNLTTVFVVFTTLFLCLPDKAQAYMSAQEIEQQVADSIRQTYTHKVANSRVIVTVNPINTALRLNDCATPLHIEIPYNSGNRVTAKATCPSPRQWSLFVTARVQQFLTVVTTRRPITRDSIISAQALTLAEKDIIRLDGNFYTRLQDVVGLSAGRNIPRGEILSTDNLIASTVIKRGDLITIEAIKGGLKIRTKGIALEEGKLGQQIDIKNQRSGRKLRGTITAAGIVQVN